MYLSELREFAHTIPLRTECASRYNTVQYHVFPTSLVRTVKFFGRNAAALQNARHHMRTTLLCTALCGQQELGPAPLSDRR